MSRRPVRRTRILDVIEVFDVRKVTGDEIVDRDNLIATGQQRVAEMRPQKSGATGYDDAGH